MNNPFGGPSWIAHEKIRSYLTQEQFDAIPIIRPGEKIADARQMGLL